jgi:hypothetical protein
MSASQSVSDRPRPGRSVSANISQLDSACAAGSARAVAVAYLAGPVGDRACDSGSVKAVA